MKKLNHLYEKASWDNIRKNIKIILSCISTFGVDNILNLAEFDIENPDRSGTELKTITLYTNRGSIQQLKAICKPIDGVEFIAIIDLWENDIAEKLYNELRNIYGTYEYQKEYLTETPEKYKDLEAIGYNKQILEEFDWLFNAADMGLI